MRLFWDTYFDTMFTNIISYELHFNMVKRHKINHIRKNKMFYKHQLHTNIHVLIKLHLNNFEKN